MFKTARRPARNGYTPAVFFYSVRVFRPLRGCVPRRRYRRQSAIFVPEALMEPYYAGWLSILPPVIAITLALVSKEVFSSLLIGILSGTVIYTSPRTS